MQFLIADTFQSALTRLDNESQKAAFELKMDPSANTKRFRRVARQKILAGSQ